MPVAYRKVVLIWPIAMPGTGELRADLDAVRDGLEITREADGALVVRRDEHVVRIPRPELESFDTWEGGRGAGARSSLRRSLPSRRSSRARPHREERLDRVSAAPSRATHFLSGYEPPVRARDRAEMRPVAARTSYACASGTECSNASYRCVASARVTTPSFGCPPMNSTRSTARCSGPSSSFRSAGDDSI
jgi:hypothetical protein